MKKLLNILIGDYYTLRLKDFLSKKLPTKAYKAEQLKEQEQCIKIASFYSSFVNSGDLCFDVGANVGNRIKPLLALNATVVAVEPQEHCHRFLKHRFGDRIKIVTQGLGESETVKDFYISNVSTLSTFSKDWIKSVNSQRFIGYNWNKVVKINMTTLDKLLSQYGTPTFIKIDVEGYELDVLKGLTKPVNMISFEYAVPEQIDKLIECIKKIQSNDSAIECNFSVDESMVFASERWLSVEDMINYIPTKEFIDTDFGDIYVRLKR